MSAKKLLVYGALSAILAAGAFAAIGAATNPAFSQIYEDDDDSSRSTGTASSDATRLWGDIGSIQRDENRAPAWITSGHWRLAADSPVTEDDNDDANVHHFSALIHMVSIRDGTSLHQHYIYDFEQTSIEHFGDGVTRINGTMTVTLNDEPHENVEGSIRLQNDMMAIWLDREELDDHFGPTPIYGLVLPDRFKIDDDNWDDDDTTAAQRGLGDDDNGRDDDSGTATQGFRDDDDDRDDDDSGQDGDDDDDAYDG